MRSDASGTEAPGRRPRLGAIGFLNTRPLTWGLEADDTFDLVYDVPSGCADALAAGRIDVGLIPVVEVARQPGRWVVPGIALGALGEVLTVRLFYRGDLGAVRVVAADTSSRTSVAMLRLLLRVRYGIDPELRPAAPDLDAMLHEADAALLIGDPVLPLVEAAATGPGAAGRRYLDLGREWVDHTGLPFVFAVWAGAESALTPAQVARLQRARREGQAHISDIARGFQRERAGSAALYERYLRDHMCFDLGPAQVAGVEAFFRLAVEHGVLDAAPPLRFYPTCLQPTSPAP